MAGIQIKHEKIKRILLELKGNGEKGFFSANRLSRSAIYEKNAPPPQDAIRFTCVSVAFPNFRALKFSTIARTSN